MRMLAFSLLLFSSVALVKPNISPQCIEAESLLGRVKNFQALSAW